LRARRQQGSNFCYTEDRCKDKLDVVMTPEQQALYDRIASFSLDDPDAPFPFSHKLAKENGWTLAYAQRAIANINGSLFSR